MVAQKFTVRNIDGTGRRKHDTLPELLVQYKSNKAEWSRVVGRRRTAATVAQATASKTSAAAGVVKRRTKKKTKKSNQIPRTVVDVMECNPNDGCHHCDLPCSDRACGHRCYQNFRRACKEVTKEVEIKGPRPNIGYGAFAGPNATFARGDILGEYLGEVRPGPRDARAIASRYVFEFGKGDSMWYIDSDQAGNWTRYANSHCRPNLDAKTVSIGRRTMVIFIALRAIRGGDELCINYGREYFERLGINCECDAKTQPHLPKEAGSAGTGATKNTAKKTTTSAGKSTSATKQSIGTAKKSTSVAVKSVSIAKKSTSTGRAAVKKPTKNTATKTAKKGKRI
jgi:hypothetical protein